MNNLGDSLEVTEKQGVKIIGFSGSGFLDEEKIDLVGDQLFKAATEDEKPRIVLDMSNIRFCSSSIIGKFVALYKAITNKGGSIKFTGLQKPIAEVFKVTKLDKLFDIQPTVEEAVSSLKE